MSIIEAFLLFTPVWIFLVWWGINIERCYRQRMRIINKQHEHAMRLLDFNLFDEWSEFRKIDLPPYNAHMNALIFCRDPMKLYHPKIQELMK
jgi:hypothetical protein